MLPQPALAPRVKLLPCFKWSETLTLGGMNFLNQQPLTWDPGDY